MRILVIGGTGFIGPHGVRSLTEMGHEVTLFHRGLAKPNQALAVREVLGERRHLSDFADEWKRLAPEVVLDMIPVTEQDARVLMSTFKGTACRLVVISSADVYRAYGRLHGTEPGPPDPLPLTEDAPLRERLYPYRGETPRREDDPKRWMDDYDKILVEQVVMGDPELPGTILRLAAVYGPGRSSPSPFLLSETYGRQPSGQLTGRFGGQMALGARVRRERRSSHYSGRHGWPCRRTNFQCS